MTEAKDIPSVVDQDLGSQGLGSRASPTSDRQFVGSHLHAVVECYQLVQHLLRLDSIWFAKDWFWHNSNERKGEDSLLAAEER